LKKATVSTVCALSLGIVACGSNPSSDGESKSKSAESPTGLIDQGNDLKTYNRKANEVCSDMFNKLDKVGSVNLTSYLQADGVSDLEQLSEKSVRDINKRGLELNRSKRKIESAAYKEIQALEAPEDQKANVALWIKLREGAQSPDDVPSISIGEGTVSKKDQDEASQRTAKGSTADAYSTLMGLSKCNSLNKKIKVPDLPPGTQLPEGVKDTVSGSTVNPGDKLPTSITPSQVQPVRELKSNDPGEIQKYQKLAQSSLLLPQRVASVDSPDQITLKSGKKIKLAGVAAGAPGSCYTKTAQSALKKLIGKKKVSVEYPFVNGKPFKKLAYIFQTQKGKSGFPENDNLNLKLVLDGGAVSPTKKAKGDVLYSGSQIASRVAKMQLKGVWSKCQDESLELSGL